MQRERLPLPWFASGLLLAVGLTCAARHDQRAPSPATPPEPVIVVSTAPAADPLALADAQYRRGEPARAAETIRAIATTDELRSLAELYEQFAVSYAIGMAPTAHVTDAFTSLREAQRLDVALGGAFASALFDRMKRIAPAAAASFEADDDAVGAHLARQTAEILGR